MTDRELLEKIKKRNGLAGNTFHDETLLGYIEDVKLYLKDAGVKAKVLKSSLSVGCIARGVMDLWNYGSGVANFSPYFIQRAIQLSKQDESDIPKDELDKIGD